MPGLAKVVRLVDGGDGGGEEAERTQDEPANQNQLPVPLVFRVQDFDFFDFLDLGLLVFFFAFFLASAPKTRSQFSQNFGVAPVRTIGPPMITILLPVTWFAGNCLVRLMGRQALRF